MLTFRAMRILKTILFIAAISLLTACSKEEAPERMPGFDEPVIAGYEMRSITGDYIGSIGYPNIKLYEGEDYNSSKYFFAGFPNPASDMINIFVQERDAPGVKKIWMVTGRLQGDPEKSALNQGMYSMYAGGTPLFQAEFSGSSVAIDLRDIHDGYYRIYLKIGEVILHDNIAIFNQSKYLSK